MIKFLLLVVLVGFCYSMYHFYPTQTKHTGTVLVSKVERAGKELMK